MTSPVLLVSMGTDHHRFDRLSDWVEDWLARPAAAGVECRIQQGGSRVPAGATPLGVLAREEFLEEIKACTVLVCQGGPGSVLDARRLGFVPIAVPRLAALDEVVDDHQVSFTRSMAAVGWARAAETRAELHAALDAAFADPRQLRCPLPDSTAPAAAVELERLLRHTPRRGIQVRRIPRALRLAATTLRGIRVPGALDRATRDDGRPRP